MRPSPAFSLRAGAGHLLVCRQCETLLDALQHLRLFVRPTRRPKIRRLHRCVGFRCSWCGPVRLRQAGLCTDAFGCFDESCTVHRREAPTPLTC
jgi:hypothetical protein